MSLLNKIFILTVAIVCILYNVSGDDEVSLQRSAAVGTSCATKCNSDPGILNAMIYEQDFTNESALKCFCLCWQNEVGFRKDGKTSLKGILRWVTTLWADQYEKVNELVKNCVQNIPKGKDDEEALQLAKCLVRDTYKAGLRPAKSKVD